MHRKVVFYKHYFETFFDKQEPKVQRKIIYVLRILEDLERVPENHFKHIKGTPGLYEARIKLGSNIYRVLCFFDSGSIIVLLNAFQKKSQKTPKKEIRLAEKLKHAYYEEKKY